MNYFKRISLVVVVFLLGIGCSNSTEKNQVHDLTWTFTYLKANEGRRYELKQYVVKNWFIMDSIAVKKGLFKDYELIENLDKTSKAEWDYIVAVEYYTNGTYSDVSEGFEEIRKSHEIININGLTFQETGRVIKSETIKRIKK